jgi:hypothetical protein
VSPSFHIVLVREKVHCYENSVITYHEVAGPTAPRRPPGSPIGGSVRTTKSGQDGLWVFSSLVNDAKTQERWDEQLRDAAERMEAFYNGQAVEPAKWRRYWSDITGDQ